MTSYLYKTNAEMDHPFKTLAFFKGKGSKICQIVVKQDSIELNPKPLANAPSKTLDISNAPKMS